MKNVKLYEFKDLKKKKQKEVKERFINYQVDADIQVLQEDLAVNLITEKEFYNQLGCSKYYAESTGWFIPSCYYEKHKKEVESDVKETLKNWLFLKNGKEVKQFN